MAKFRVQTELTASKTGTQEVRSQMDGIAQGAQGASVNVKEFTRSIGAGISVVAVLRANLQALQPVMERNGQLFRESMVHIGASEGAVRGLTLAVDSFIHPSKIIENAITATAEGSKLLAEALVGETTVVVNLTAAKLKQIEAYKASAAARALANKAATDTIAKLEFELAWEGEHTRALGLGAAALREWAAGRAAASFSAAHPLATPEDIQRIHDLNLALGEEAARGEALLKAAAAAKEFAEKLQAVVDKADPAAAATRQLATDVDLLKQAFKHFNTPAAEQEILLARLTGDWSALTATLQAVQLEMMDTAIVQRHLNDLMGVGGGHDLNWKPDAPKGSMKVDSSDIATDYQKAMEEANKTLAANLEQGLKGAFASAIIEFANGGEDALKNFGESLKQILIQSVAEYLSSMLTALAKELAIRIANVIKEAAARRAFASSGQAGPQQSGGYGEMLSSGYSAYSSGGAGMSSGAAGMGIFVVALAAIVAIFKADADRAKKNNYGTGAGITVTNGAVSGSWEGKLTETGPKIMAAMGNMVNALSEATGAWVAGTQQAVILIRNDKKAFQLQINEVVVGTFNTAEEAVIGAAKAMFASGNLSKQLDPIIQKVISGFHGTDPQKLIDSVVAVQKIIDEIAGVSEIEVALRNLPQRVNALTASLEGMGVGATDAAALAAKWKISQLQSLRDQITGHEASAAEQRAQKEREALLFNAQLEMDRADILAKKAYLEAQIAVGKAGVEIGQAELTARVAIENERYRMGRAGIENAMAIEQARANVLTQGANVSINVLNAQLAAYNAALAALDKITPIDLKEIKIGGGKGRGGGKINTGPSPAEQLALDIAAFNKELDALDRSLSGGLLGRLAELTNWYAEQSTRAAELGIPLDRINQLYQDQLAVLAKDTLAGLGLASVATQRQMEELRIALEFLRAQGEITEEQFHELGNAMYISLVDGLLQYVDNEEVRMALEDLRFRMEIANYKLQFEYLRALGFFTDAEIRIIKKLFDDIEIAYDNGLLDFQIPDIPDRPNNTQQNTGPDPRAAAEQALRQALDRLRNAVEGLRAFQEGLLLSSASPLTIAQQYEVAAQQYADMLAAAQGGDLAAIEGLGAAAQTYLDLAGQMFGTAGAGYGAIFDAVSQQIAGIVAAGQSVLDGAPAQMQGTEQRLDTIAEILNEMRILFGGAPGWNPTAPPMPAPHGLGSNGNLTLGNFGGGQAVSVRAPELSAKIDQLIEATATAARETKADRMKKSATSLSGYTGSPIGTKRSA